MPTVNNGPAISTQVNTQAVMEASSDAVADVSIVGANPRILLTETGLAANTGVWDISVDNGVFSYRTRTDVDGAGATFMSVTRSGTTATIAALAATSITLTASGGVSVLTGNLLVSTLGMGLRVAEGADAKQGVTAAMVAGTLVVANASVTANSRIILTRQDGGANPGAVFVSARTAGVSFTITSTNVADTGTVAFEIFEPA